MTSTQDESVIEWAARAIFLCPEYTGDPPPPECEWDETDERICKALARAAIAALREPTDMVAMAGQHAAEPEVHLFRDDAATIWRAMIDHILSEQERA